MRMPFLSWSGFFSCAATWLRIEIGGWVSGGEPLPVLPSLSDSEDLSSASKFSRAVLPRTPRRGIFLDLPPLFCRLNLPIDDCI